MSIIPSLPFDIENGDDVDADPVMANFTAIQADVNANAAASGDNSDITSLSGLTTPLSISQGGTDANTATAARTNLSAAKSGQNADITELSAVTSILAPQSEPLVVGSDTSVSITSLDGTTLQELNVATAVEPTSAVPLAQLQLLTTGTIKAIRPRIFSAVGASTYNPDSTLICAYVKGVAGGGGGASNFSGTVGSSGGGSGAAFEGILTVAQIGTSQIITIGAGGAAGNDGGLTSIGTLASVNGGKGAQYASSGVNAPGGAPGSTGSVTSGLVLLPGNQGNTGNGAGGWGGANPGTSGSGGASIFGGAGSGVGASGAGGNGVNGGGGAGGMAAAGGNGGNGLVIIYELCSA